MAKVADGNVREHLRAVLADAEARGYDDDTPLWTGENWEPVLLTIGDLRAALERLTEQSTLADERMVDDE